MQQNWRVFLAAWIGVCGLAWARIPGQDNPRAYTERQYRLDQVDYNLRTLLDPYKQVGHRDPKWDDQAIQFITSMSKHFANAGSANRDRIADAPKLEDLLAQGRALIKSGCDDALVVDLYSITLLDSRLAEEYRPIARQSVDALANSHYSVARATNSARRALRNTDPTQEKDLYDRYEQSIFDGDLATMSSGDFPGIDRRVVFRNIVEDLNRWTVARDKEFVELAQAGKADPWLTDMATGKYHLRAAWAARGSGWANTVTPEGWKIFGQELEKADKSLTDAWNIAPNFPESAEQMITVAMAQSDRASLRTWFDRAVEAQFDYKPAYDTYLYAIYPRWLGSYPEMYAFGLECAATKRYDTIVPYFLIETLNTIRDDMSGDWRYWTLPASFDKAFEVLAGYGEHDASMGDRPWYYSQIVGYAWQTQLYKQGRAALDKIDGKVFPAAMTYTGCLPQRTQSGVYAFTGDNADTVKQAEASAAAGKIDDAITAYSELAKKVGPDDRSAFWIRGRAQELAWKKSFDAGEWVDLCAGPDLLGFECLNGKFSREGNTFIAVSDRSGANLICGNKFGPRWEMQTRVEVLAPEQGQEANPHDDAGVIFGWVGSVCYGVLAAPGAHEMIWCEGRNPSSIIHGNPSPAPALTLRMWDGQLDVSVDAHEWVKNRRTYEWAHSPAACVGVCTLAGREGKRIKISEWKIRRLDEEPAREAREK